MDLEFLDRADRCSIDANRSTTQRVRRRQENLEIGFNLNPAVR